MEERRYNLETQENSGFDAADQAAAAFLLEDPYDLPLPLANLAAVIDHSYVSVAASKSISVVHAIATSRSLDAMRIVKEVVSALPLEASDRQAAGRLVTRYAERYAGCGVPMDDLIQEGLLGLLEKVRTGGIYDKGRLMDAARLMIRHAIYKEPIIDIPIGLYEALLRVQASRTHACEDGSDTTFGQACNDYEQDQHAMEAVQLAATVTSLDVPATYDDAGTEVSFADILQDPAPDPLAVVVTRERDVALRNAIETHLKPDEQKVIALRFGLIDDVSYASSSNAVAEKLGLSLAKVRSIEERAIRLLKHHLHLSQLDVAE